MWLRVFRLSFTFVSRLTNTHPLFPFHVLFRCSMANRYKKLVVTWSHLSPTEVAAKVKQFFFYYAVNRHKMCTVTPAYHAEAYSPDDNRFDLRQFLYNTRWPRKFRTIDQMAKNSEKEHEQTMHSDTKKEL